MVRKITVHDQPKQKAQSSLKNTLGVVVHACHPSYSGTKVGES
jgi:hypothetical protein